MKESRLKKYEAKKLEEYFLEKLPNSVGYEEAYDILLTLAGIRSGALVMGTDRDQIELLKNFCKEFDLNYLINGGEALSFLDRILGRDSRTFKDGFFISKDKKRLEKLEESEGDFYGFNDTSVGRFLGYPEESTDYYAESSSPPAKAYNNKIEELREADKLDEEDLKYLSLVSYVPRPDKENVLEAVEKGKKREEKLQRIDELLGTSIGERYVEETKSSGSILT